MTCQWEEIKESFALSQVNYLIICHPISLPALHILFQSSPWI